MTNYLISQFPEKEYTISQRLDILDVSIFGYTLLILLSALETVLTYFVLFDWKVLAASSMVLSGLHPTLPASKSKEISSQEAKAKGEADWQIIINERLQAKTKRYTKVYIVDIRLI